MSTACIIGWGIAFVVFVLCELATSMALVSIWFAAASVVALIFALFRFSFIVQLAVFVISSVILLIVTRPLVKKLQKNIRPTNYELDVGKEAVVTETIDSSKNKGRVRLNGTYWQARTEDGRNIPDGETVTVLKVEGTTLVVK